jgi:hypothetical protein
MRCIANATSETDEHGQIEITEEMIKAGIDALLDFDRRYESDEDAVRRIFIAMNSAHSNR